MVTDIVRSDKEMGVEFICLDFGGIVWVEHSEMRIHISSSCGTHILVYEYLSGITV